jgi:O-antigen ligase
MTSTSKEKKSSSVWFLILGIMLVNLYFKPSFGDPFNIPKLILLLLIAGWIFGHLINSYRETPIRFRSTDFYSLALSGVFLTTMFVSSLLTDVRFIAFFGDTQRKNGFLTYLSLVILFLFASRTLEYKFSVRIYKVAIINGLIISVYGLMQISGKDFVQWNNPYNAIIGTVGNPNFASAVMAILSILSLSSLLISQISIFYKGLAVLVFITSQVAIVLSQSRQGLVTLAFAILFYISTYFYINFRKLGLLTISVSILLSGLAIIGMLQKGPFAPLLYKESVSVRGFYWRAGVEMVKDKPFTGIGIDRYGAYFKEFREVSYPLRYGFDLTSTNAHNTVIQLFATGGIFVGLSYLVILGYIFKTGLRTVRNSKSDQQKIALGLLSAWVGFQAQSFISIDNIGISVWGWLLGGSILGVSRSSKAAEEISLLKKNNLKKNNYVKINLLQPLISSLVVIPIIIISVSISKSESDFSNIRGLANSSTLQKNPVVLTETAKIINNSLSDHFYKLSAVRLLLASGFLNEGYMELKKFLKADPRNLDALLALAETEQQMNKLSNAIAIRNQITNLDPWNANNYLMLMMLYKNNGEIDKARLVKENIMSFASNTQVANKAEEILP